MTHGHSPVADAEIGGEPVAEMFFEETFVRLGETVEIGIAGYNNFWL